MQKIEIVAIGNEILKGSTVNTNAAEISKTLFEAGYLPYRHTVLPDDPLLLKEGLKECLARSEIVITTGGLGPTCDDITRQTAAELFASDFHFNAEIAAQLKQRYGNLTISLENQATVPTKAEVLKNEVGTAPGLAFRSSTGALLLMPGVPREMKEMLHLRVIPYLTTHFPSSQAYLSQTLHFFSLSESMVDPILRKLNAQYPEIDFGIYPAQGTLAVVGTTQTEKNIKAAHNLTKAMAAIKQHFAANVFEAVSGKIEAAVHELFMQNRWTLSLAESCTGGGIAAKLTKLPGASAYFLGSEVCYSYELKKKLLGVSAEILADTGAVSEQTVKAMVLGLLARTDSDFGIAVSGIAGPDGGSTDKPVGTVWIAVAKKGQPAEAKLIQGHGNREMIIERSINAALATLLVYCRQYT